jgi:hypothetical protein
MPGANPLPDGFQLIGSIVGAQDGFAMVENLRHTSIDKRSPRSPP